MLHRAVPNESRVDASRYELPSTGCSHQTTRQAIAIRAICGASEKTSLGYQAGDIGLPDPLKTLVSGGERSIVGPLLGR